MLESRPTLLIAESEDSYLSSLCRSVLPTSIRVIHSEKLLIDEFSDVNIILGAPDRLADWLPYFPKLQWIQSTWAGVKPLVLAQRHDYVLTGLKGVFGQAMSEYVLGWLLALERQILTYAADVSWNQRPLCSVQGKHVGIMGTGDIGRAVASTLSHMGMVCRGFNQSGEVFPEFQTCFSGSNMRDFACGLDYLVCLMPDTPKTQDLVSRDLLMALDSDAILINAGRGNCIDELDLLWVLDQGHLRYCVLDVFRQEPLPQSHPFWSHPQVYVTSHTSAPTDPAGAVRVFEMNLTRFLNGESLLYAIDFEKGY